MFGPQRFAPAPTVALAGSLWISACANSGPADDHLHSAGTADHDAGAGRADFMAPSAPEIAGSQAELRCDPARASDDLPARSVAMTRPKTASTTPIATDDLFSEFRSYCGGCHVDQAQGNFQVSRQDFHEKVAQDSLDRIRSNDTTLVMPKYGPAYKDRAPTDPVVGFSNLLEAWFQAGRPDDVFYANTASDANGGSYSLTKDVGTQLTNLGNCVPGKAGFASETEKSAQLDQMFAQAAALPERLDQTDLFTFDSKILAEQGVVAYVPGYPLWSDGAKKLRMVRVPRGTSIKFDKATQTFEVPPNTRFYKTFLKQVVDKDGRVSFRKMETRVIVARPDDDTKDGLDRPTALFGSYIWNDQETEATLLRDPLRNGKPFRDHLLTYYLDEQKVEALIRQGVPDLEKELEDQHLQRKYAVPGSDRCLHCHMGSPSKSFVLGFTPLQIQRRPEGEGGVIEPTGPDELTQLLRLISYGVITGINSPDEVTLLENSQGSRAPRNDYELVAQGYMLGNCSHCHNPRGFPSYAAPELRDVLNFLPSDTGGIFQFPLDKFSPRIKRGVNQDVPVAYITPSLYDLAVAYAEVDPDTGAVVAAKTVVYPEGMGARSAPIFAPWRSLIYRNVDTPFSYEDDSAIFPHMPRDTAGYDCRARQLLGTWMVSIPASFRSTPGTYLNPASSKIVNLDVYPEANYNPVDLDVRAQPYVEVRPDEGKYEQRKNEADARVAAFQQSIRYQYCPDTTDIIDPEVEQGLRLVPDREQYQSPPGGCSDLPLAVQAGALPSPERANVQRECQFGPLPTPQRAHWFVLDLTDPPGDWQPRRGDWQDKLVSGDVPTIASLTDPTLVGPTGNEWRNIRILTGVDPWGERDGSGKHPVVGPGIRVTKELRDFALTEVPLGIWKKSDACTFAGVPRASAYSGDQRPRWMDESPDVADDPDAPVYTISPGAQVFTSICSNCHGPQADSHGRMADTVADLTGGNTRVANLRDGIFGPVTSPGDNRARVFGVASAGDLTADDWAARYLLWMGNGGTQRQIPETVLLVVAHTNVLGIPRPPAGVGNVGANMLAVAEALCQDELPFREIHGDVANYTAGQGLIFDVAHGAIDDSVKAGGTPELLALITKNGDDDLWQRICALDNPPPVRVVVHTAQQRTKFEMPPILLYARDQADMIMKDQSGNPLETGRPLLFQRSAYPSGVPIGDHRGNVQPELRDDNLAPWCILRPQTPDDVTRFGDEASLLADYRDQRHDSQANPPYCPDELVAKIQLQEQAHAGPLFDIADGADWARRGAMNAGLSVFVYLDALAKGQVKSPVAYDHCEDLQ